MKITEKQRRAASAICLKYCGWKLPQDIRPLWNELSEIGIDVGVLCNRKDNGAGSWQCVQPFTLDGEEVDNSNFIFSVYEGSSEPKNEYNIYFS